MSPRDLFFSDVWVLGLLANVTMLDFLSLMWALRIELASSCLQSKYFTN